MTTMSCLAPGCQDALEHKLKNIPALKMASEELKFEPENLDAFYTNKAKLELRETPEVVEEGLRVLRELLKGEPDLIVPLEADEYLYRFLRPCKWYPESAFGLIKRFHNYRRTHPHLCKGLCPSAEKGVLKSGIITPLPRRCADGARILLIQGGKTWKPREVSLEEILKGAMLALEAAMAEPKTQVCGVRVILDMAGLSLSHVTYFTPSFARAVLEWVQRCLPCRLKGVHVVNQPYIFNMVFAIFKPFMQEKLRKRIHFHGTDKVSLLEHIDSKALPDRYGGNLEFPTEPLGMKLYEYFCNFEEDFLVSNKYGYVKNKD
ncbi:alpha-tocopherol transfer protein-like [Athalia rosae]|uniref:alpha-tocopherol transfer protein-like n=1 Tax=Athalia rosae TaxID=37344 RepID=UPI000625F75F|nr:alpha-tocopherol transfer protein-like [Athalia rosae]XP_012252209.1 alpha-tocopherol transfer protein-like [Athalia rosae]XP_020706760.1 alpha-tocopherol transfer protein-like [Athalia rosae]